MISPLHFSLFSVVYPKVPYLAYYFSLSSLSLSTLLGSVISKNSLEYHLYADVPLYIQLYIFLTPTNCALSLESLTTTFTDILSWMNLNNCSSIHKKLNFLLLVQDRYNLTSNKLQQSRFQLKCILTIMECRQDQKDPIYLSRIFLSAIEASTNFQLNLRIARHSAINGLIKTALSAAEVPLRLEPQGLVHGDNKRPDGVSTMPWSEGRCLAWDFTCPDTLAPSHINRAILEPGIVASDAEALKSAKYAQLPTSMLFVPIAIETFGAFGEEAAKFMSELGRRLTRKTQDSRSASFLFQRLSMTVQRGNAACVLGTIPEGCTFDSFSLI